MISKIERQKLQISKKKINSRKGSKDQNQGDLKAQKLYGLRTLEETEGHCSTWEIRE